MVSIHQKAIFHYKKKRLYSSLHKKKEKGERREILLEADDHPVRHAVGNKR